MSEQQIRDQLWDEPLPDGEAAEERGWSVVSTAFAGAAPKPPRTRRFLRPVLAICVSGATVAIALTPPGEALGEWVADAVDPAPAGPALTSLPAQGRILVTSRAGSWVVQRDASQRRLGDYASAAWSPNGRFVIATRGNQLVALDPRGSVRWALTRSSPISAPTWEGPDGYRIAYLAGATLRVVSGDGSGDHAIGPTRIARPGWRPGGQHELAYVDRAGRIAVVSADTRRVLWRATAPLPPERLLWTPDGRQLLAVSESALQAFDSAGRQLSRVRLPSGARAATASLDLSGDRLAIVRAGAGGQSEVVALRTDSTAGARRLFAASGRFGDIAWSPDGRWLLVTWPNADQWIFVRTTYPRQIRTVSNVTRQFDPGGRSRSPFPKLGGWCCP